ncbi:MAG: hypothetical protein ABSH56_28350 [Bryobacteraceae bacterium]
MDRTATFLQESCHRGDGQVKASDLYKGYAKWAEGKGERPMSGRAFAERMREGGIPKKVTREATFYIGVCLRSPLFEDGQG